MKAVRIFSWLAILVVGVLLVYRYVNTEEHISDGPGGPFTLTAHTGKKMSDTDFLGRYMLVYFGYSYCPDVCRIELHKLTTALTLLEEEGYDLILRSGVMFASPKVDITNKVLQRMSLK